ncbi:hypothetical protein OIDMADRAFT_47317 [Oidiodendron maius Zn]|uniref:Gfd2/YDR514C-like C-terminal domain-containing protein n=1 Tax=Oidiodendron maius (strain Zn) TaxID=913774 RepID=A0A0C3D7S3_OIDMZ|nr:hypothetical protein OIDMADRAFT_47317 [Oidiodendron maius Zn]
MSKIYFPQNGLEQLQSIFGLQNSPIWDAVIVSFDLELLKPGAPDISQMGVSILDTRCLSLDISKSTGSLLTRHFVIGGQKRGGQKRFRRERMKFYFGTSEYRTDDRVNEVILKQLYIQDEIKGQEYRKIILVGHGLRSDLAVLQKRGIFIQEIPTIIAKFDTTYIATEVLGIKSSLYHLLKILDCPHENMHIAGNDANYTLRALLLLTYYGLRPLVSCLDAIKYLKYFKYLGLERLPDITERNAMIRASKPVWRREDFTLIALDSGSISFLVDT